MRLTLIVVALAVVALSGCGKYCSTGWRIEVGQPAVVNVPMPVAQTSGGLVAAPVGASTLERIGVAEVVPAPSRAPAASGPERAPMPKVGPCTQ